MMYGIEETLVEFREFLDSCDYRQIIETLTNGKIYKEPWSQCAVDSINGLSEPVSSLIRLCHLGQVVNEAESIFGGRLADKLTCLGILVNSGDDKWWIGGKCIIPYQGLYIICDLWNPGLSISHDRIWFGDDSVYLARLLPHLKSKRVLDLCTGTGIQAMIMASRGSTVTAVDINDRAVEIARMNCLINGLQNSVEVIKGDLYHPVLGRKYDFIIANPPFMPIAESGKESILFADGGDDGTAILRRILKGLPERLDSNGGAMIISGGFGDAGGPSITLELRSIAAENAWTVNLSLITQRPAKEEMRRLGKMFPELAGNLAKTADSLNPDITHYYAYVISIGSGYRSTEINIIKCYMSWAEQLKEMRKTKKS